MARYYVTMTWEDWPVCGSYGTIIEAKDHEEATKLCMLEMAHCEDGGGCLDGVRKKDIDLVLSQQDWHIVDCFNLDEFIKKNLADMGIAA